MEDFLRLAMISAMPQNNFSTAHVGSLVRYPVKSMRGELCEELRIETSGVAGDRAFGILDLSSRTVISAKRNRHLLDAAASLSSGELVVTLPNGQKLGRGSFLDESLTHWLERPVTLIDAATFGAAIYECPEDFENDDSQCVQWEGPRGSFVDESPLHLLTTADLNQLALERPDLQWSARRFRPNVVVDTTTYSLESMEPGQRLSLGNVEIEITKGCTRCVMTTRSQPSSLTRQLDILRHISTSHQNLVGVRAKVVTTGTVRVGDKVTVRN